MLRNFEGFVVEVLDETTLHIAVLALPDRFQRQRGRDQGVRRRVKFPGTEEWLGGKPPMAALMGSKIRFYGWEDPDVHDNPDTVRQNALRMGVNLFVYAVTSGR